MTFYFYILGFLCHFNHLIMSSKRCYPIGNWTLSQKLSAKCDIIILSLIKLFKKKKSFLRSGARALIYLTSNQKSRGDDGQGLSETLMCSSSSHILTLTHTHTRSSHSLRLASHCRVMRGVICEGGVGERRTEGLREIESELLSEMESCRGSWGGWCCVFLKASDHGKSFSFFFLLFFWLSSSDWPMSATPKLCKSGTIQPTKTNPHYRPEAFWQDENKCVWTQKNWPFVYTYIR